MILRRLTPIFILIVLFVFWDCSKNESPTQVANHTPSVSSNPNPTDAAIGISTSPTLSWTCSDAEGDAITYDVFLSMSNPPTAQLVNGQSAASLPLTGLSNNTTYYWRVISKDSKSASTIGSVWSFTTIISQRMVEVAGGTFTTGSTLVTIGNFKIENCEVTYELWTDVRAWALLNGYTDLAVGYNGSNAVGTNNPVTNVNWYDIVKWCNARSEKEALTPVYYINSNQDTVYRTGNVNINIDAVQWNANGYRLPTETEWEFAACGGNLTHGYTYSGSNTIDSVAWCFYNSGSSTHTVGTKSANELDIYDMSGNVWECCWDWYGSTYPSGGITNPKGPSTTQTWRMMRGGSCGESEGRCRVYYRYADLPFFPNSSSYIRGFRCVQN